MASADARPGSADRRHQHLVLVFQHVVAGIVEGMHLRLRQRLAEAGEEMLVEHEVLQAPADEGGTVGERLAAPRRRLQHRPRRSPGSSGMSCMKRMVLMRFPAVVRRHVGAAHVGRHLAGWYPTTPAPRGERLKRRISQPPGLESRPIAICQGIACSRQRERAVLVITSRLTCAGAQRPAEADHAAPVVHGQGHRGRRCRDAQQRLQVVDPRLQGVVVARRRGAASSGLSDRPMPTWSGTMQR
jgi:hypothetical protein